MPDAGAHLLRWFSEIVAAGGELSYQEIASWCALTGIRLLPEEVDILRAMDRARATE